MGRICTHVPTCDNFAFRVVSCAWPQAQIWLSPKFCESSIFYFFFGKMCILSCSCKFWLKSLASSNGLNLVNFEDIKILTSLVIAPSPLLFFSPPFSIFRWAHIRCNEWPDRTPSRCICACLEWDIIVFKKLEAILRKYYWTSCLFFYIKKKSLKKASNMTRWLKQASPTKVTLNEPFFFF